MTVNEAIERVKELALSTCKESNIEIDIVTWDPELTDRRIGVRIAEVSFMKKLTNGTMSGSTYMQDDVPHGLAVCAAAERLILSLLLGWADEIEHAEWRFIETLGGHE